MASGEYSLSQYLDSQEGAKGCDISRLELVLSLRTQPATGGQHFKIQCAHDDSSTRAWNYDVVVAAPSPTHVGGCQNCGPLLGPLNTRCRITVGTQKETINLTTTHVQYLAWKAFFIRNKRDMINIQLKLLQMKKAAAASREFQKPNL